MKRRRVLPEWFFVLGLLVIIASGLLVIGAGK